MAKHDGGFDIGHGGNDPGATNKKNKRKEADDALKLGTAVMNYVEKKTNNEVMCYRSRTSSQTLSLRQRSDWANAKEFDFFISFHRDDAENDNGSQNTTARGASVRVMPGHMNKASGKLAKEIANRLCPILPGRSSWVQEQNLHVLRETNMTAVLIECGFMGNETDNKIFDSKFNDIVAAIGDGIIAYLGVKVVTKETRYSVSVSGMTDKSRQKLITDFLDKNNYKYKAETYQV